MTNATSWKPGCADIEKRVGQREEEHAAEINALKNRLQEASEQQERLQKQLRRVAASGGTVATKEFEQTLESLQEKVRQLESSLLESREKCRLPGEATRVCRRWPRRDLAWRACEARTGAGQDLEDAVRAVQQAGGNRTNAENLQQGRSGDRPENPALREHLREIHEQEKQEVKESTLATRLANLWKRVEY